MAREYLCPYCFKKSEMGTVDFRCAAKGECEEENDALLAKYKGLETVIAKKTFQYRKKGLMVKMPEFADCPYCGYTTNKRLCPECHNELPNGIAESRDMTISIIGSRDSGKSNYLGVLLSELERRVIPELRNSTNYSYFGVFDELSKEEYRKRFGQFLYPDGEKREKRAHVVPRTESAMDKWEPPIVCGLRTKDRKDYFLSFMDSAGEDFEDKLKMEKVMPYIACSKGIIFLLDPLKIAGVRKVIDEKMVTVSSNNEISDIYKDIILNTAKLIRLDKKMKSTSNIDIPVVIVFSKFDVLRDMVSPSSILWKESPHSKIGKFDNNDAMQVSAEVKGLLSEWGAEEFMELVEREFKNVIYMPCSAFGTTPKDDGTVDMPKSLRIEDAVLWIMKELKYLPSIN